MAGHVIVIGVPLSMPRCRWRGLCIAVDNGKIAVLELT